MSPIATASSATNRLSAWLRTLRLLPLLALSFLLAGCPADNVPLEVVGYNHTDRSIGYFSVNGGGSTFLMKHSGGGGYTCCITVPPVYKPGMKATITWSDEAGENPRSREIAVPPYGPDDFGAFAVHFLRDGQIKVFVTRYGLGHPDYNLKGDEAKL
ncbi:DUF3304 domain-containing protein [Dyella sp. M7H15-1]|uniref:DUF3304 domain-containing protein n=1 Tax=Dyella sp. M7H15-1 TaxID=2501295 RepID=UPI001004D96A|nr:DUF3304 domain-containing protein [Dyella sp. M7H15-1]QAU23573.1 DUF3304 domain-containing protein [Dyella sp. M7H15-1]